MTERVLETSFDSMSENFDWMIRTVAGTDCTDVAEGDETLQK
jgi:hypothetical protein